MRRLWASLGAEKMSTVKLYSTVTSTTDLLWYIEDDVLSLWTVGFFSHYLSCWVSRRPNITLFHSFLNAIQILTGRHRCIWEQHGLFYHPLLTKVKAAAYLGCLTRPFLVERRGIQLLSDNWSLFSPNKLQLASWISLCSSSRFTLWYKIEGEITAAWWFSI